MSKKVQSTSDKEMQFCCLSICRDMHLETQVGPFANQLNVLLTNISIISQSYLNN